MEIPYSTISELGETLRFFYQAKTSILSCQPIPHFPSLSPWPLQSVPKHYTLWQKASGALTWPCIHARQQATCRMLDCMPHALEGIAVIRGYAPFLLNCLVFKITSAAKLSSMLLSSTSVLAYKMLR